MFRSAFVIVFGLFMQGRTATKTPTFEVASVKRAAGGGPPGDIPRNMDSSPGSFAMRNVPLRYALEWAYDLKDYEISGPAWIVAEDRYDIIAKASGPATNDQMRPMLQTLLLERFKMKVHRETRQLPVYVLLPGKGPAKTGLAGVYDYTVDLSGLGFNGQPPQDPTAGPSIFTAVQENLNLRLEAQRAPVEVLVIDQVEKIPVEN